MLIRIGFDIAFELLGRTPMVLMLYTHPSRQQDLRATEEIVVEPKIPLTNFSDTFGNRCARIHAPAGVLRLKLESVIEDSGEPDYQPLDAPQHNIEDLPDETLQFLLPSRYCEVDKLTAVAWKLFGGTPPGYARVKAIFDWVHEHVTFGYHLADATKSALDVYNDGKGVCRDFNHLAVTFCRCMNIPARYATGYLGDIAFPPSGPMDFSAWFQAYLGGEWYTFDARHNHPRVGRILMATGRDAADVALTTNFGRAILQKFVVVTEEIPAIPRAMRSSDPLA
jgi:transglutaminase-like putative cysteine protease